MGRQLDLGGGGEGPQKPVSGNPIATPGPAYRSARLTWKKGAEERVIVVLPMQCVSAGRDSTREICLRIHPTSEPSNREKTFRISSTQFRVEYHGEGLRISDPGSTNGTVLKSSGPLEKDRPVEIRKDDEISVAGVLNLELDLIPKSSPVPMNEDLSEQMKSRHQDSQWLQELLIGPDKPGLFEFARIRRIDNLPSEEYVLLFGKGRIGFTRDSLISLGAGTSPKPTTRGLDLGEAVPEALGVLYYKSGSLWLEGNAPGEIRIGNREVGRLMPVPLSNGDVVTCRDGYLRIETPLQ